MSAFRMDTFGALFCVFLVPCLNSVQKKFDSFDVLVSMRTVRRNEIAYRGAVSPGRLPKQVCCQFSMKHRPIGIGISWLGCGVLG